MTVKSSVSLTDDQYSFARDLVDTGRYASVSAVVQQGVELLRRQVTDDSLERTALVELLAERSAGTGISATDMDKNLARLLEAKRRAHDLRP